MKRIALIVSFAVFLVALAVVIGGNAGPAQAQSLPEVVFIGEGPGDFTSPLDDFIIKIDSPFHFEFREGPTTTLTGNNRIWGLRGTNSVGSIWHETVDLGSVEQGCIVEYVGIDDDIDDRPNFFQVNGTTVETVTQGMVFRGSFVVPEDGSMTFVAVDSVSGWYTPCADRVEPTATPTLEPTVTGTATPGPTPTATGTSTPGPTPTPTSTAIPPTPEPSPTPTKRPREYSCTRINFEMSGDDAARGLYIVQETGGKLLASWYALDGWQDSGWFKDIDITHENVYVKVLYYRGPDSEPVELVILNHAPDSPYGWMSWGICHAIEVAWPGEKPEGATVPEEPAPAAPEQAEQSAPSTAEEPAPAAAEQTGASDQPAPSAVTPPDPPAPEPDTETEEQDSLAPASLNG